jgi:hypothetical protein
MIKEADGAILVRCFRGKKFKVEYCRSYYMEAIIICLLALK